MLDFFDGCLIVRAGTLLSDGFTSSNTAEFSLMVV